MEFVEIPGFMGYSVNMLGEVRNDETGRVLVQTVNGHGVAQVGLMKEGLQRKRSVALLVANAFLDPPHPELFNTPIHLDGDNLNNRVDNLMWRPRWFAVKYGQQFVHYRGHGPWISKPLIEIGTHEKFKNSWDATTKYGLLDKEIIVAVTHRTYVWPTYQRFEVLE